MSGENPIIILGERSLVTPYLVERLASADLNAEVFLNEPLTLPVGFRYVPLETMGAHGWQAPGNSIVISLLPLNDLARNLPRIANAQSIIALGSTSRFCKISSNDPAERTTAENLEMAENILKPWCLKHRIVFTLLRPTLIYDGRNDQSITRMARIIYKSRMFPLASPASGLRQPIHADDVAKAIMGALGNSSVYFKSLNIAGGEVLTYRRMVERVFRAMGLRPRVLMLPMGLLRSGMNFASRLGLLRDKPSAFEVFRRMNEDLIYDTAEGLQLLGYSPRRFEPELKVS